VSIDDKSFRHVVGHFMTGVTVITARWDGVDHGVTASSVASLSTEPASMVACVNKTSRTGQALHRSGGFAINILSDAQGFVAERFASSSDDKFAGLEIRYGGSGAPLLVDALAHIDCRVREEVEGGTHRVFIGDVLAASAGEGEPLAYYRGGFGRFQFSRDDAVFEEIRERIVNRRQRPGEVLDVGTLADELDVARSAVYYALTKLATEALVARDLDRGYVVVPIDAAACEEAFDARCSIELGVVAAKIGRLGEEQLARLESRLSDLVPLIHNGRFVDVEAYIEANSAFHEQLIALSGNEALLKAYRRLSLKGLMSQALGATDETSDEMVADHVALTEALRREDETAARQALISHRERVTSRSRELLAAAGGSV
jgi:DNA-binding GntR family transcriptional regulator/flavin reductase (DIM6/NTAB) family NADH-FMN oxidoreductase RutF